MSWNFDCLYCFVSHRKAEGEGRFPLRSISCLWKKHYTDCPKDCTFYKPCTYEEQLEYYYEVGAVPLPASIAQAGRPNLANLPD